MLNMFGILEKPLITITNIIWSFDRTTKQLQVLLVKRAQPPYQNSWALPETFMRTQESADEAALRLIREKIGLNLSDFYTEQLATFTNQQRTSNERALSLAYMTFLPEMPALKAGYGALEARWFAFSAVQKRYCLSNRQLTFQTAAEASETAYYQALKQQQPDQHLAFDHEWILRLACQRIKNKLNYQPNILLVLGAQFTLKEARMIYAAFLGIKPSEIDNSNFKKTHKHLFKDIGISSSKQIGRPAKLYRLASNKVEF
ncbi:NUDIX domain-containing protein [Agrilactobacillus yilanensis]|uniref:NUDIX domain-containing protein n=1 Tax=Agrilactobacillus yilanensis TaxID=2485997 RepID=A0ABW4J3V4_9LACO|nr:NUDIX domain-containing protein [Agrilactobacillus yilanensis]